MRRTTTLLAALAAVFWVRGPASAAETTDPGADSFSILYYLNDGDGNRIRLMSTNDLKYAINQARCECGQTIEAQIRLINTGTTYTQTTIEGFIGPQCALAETSFNPQFRPCTRFTVANTQSFIQGYSVDFGPIWLGSGMVGDTTNPRGPDVATPAASCIGPGGQSGVWLCGYFDENGGCQAEEFFINGTQHNNAGTNSEEAAMGITFDYQSPLTAPETVSALAGDEAVVMSWQSKASTDIYGYRVLCEEADTGLPAVEGVVENPGLAATTYGTIYYTKENLCPDGPFSSQVGSEDPAPDPIGTTGDVDTDTDGTTTDATTTDATTTDATTTDATTTDGTTTVATTTDGTTGSDTTGEMVVSACPADRPATGICSLKWEYVCSGHIAAGTTNTGSTRIRGLENGKRYNLLLVGYDQAGNPLPIKLVENIEPVAANDLWEQCEADGNVCGDAGFCNVDGDRSARGGVAFSLGLLGLGLLGLARRRTRLGLARRRIRKTA